MPSAYKTCLLVEDDPEDQEFFISTLHAVSSRTGCYAVSNGEEALHTLKQEGLVPDYIFTDIEMPRMNGLELLQEVKSTHAFRNIPVVVYSSMWSEDQALKVKMLGAVAFYSKASFHKLPDILRHYFGGPKPFSIL